MSTLILESTGPAESVASPLHRDLTIRRGATWSRAWLFRRQADQEPFLTADWTVRAQVRERASSTVVLHEWSTSAGNATIDNTGHLTLIVPASLSASWTWTYGEWDLEVSSGDVVHVLLAGHVEVLPEVTR